MAEQDIPVHLPGYGDLKSDIVWGGNYFGIVDLRGSTLRISPDNASELSRVGIAVRDHLCLLEVVTCGNNFLALRRLELVENNSILEYFRHF